jgi:outer membrane protein
MKKKIYYPNPKATFLILISSFWLINYDLVYAQEAIREVSLEQAISYALEHNHQIIIAQNNKEIADNNATIGNAGLLPQVFIDGGYRPAIQNIDMTFFTDIPPIRQENAWTRILDANIGLAYNLFDGFNRFYTFDRLKSQTQAVQAQSRMEIENTLLAVISTYLEAARLQQEVNIHLNTLNLSKQRLERSRTGYEFGTHTRLEVYNAEVDLNTDSVALVRSQVSLKNTKRNLNILMGFPARNNFTVNTNIEINNNLEAEPLLDRALRNNATLRLAKTNQQVSELDLRIARSGAFPTLDLNLGYGYNRQRNDAGFIQTQEIRGFNGALVFRYNLFNGRQRVIQTQNAQISVESGKEQVEQIQKEVERDVLNAFENYQNTLFLLNMEQRNLETVELNFQRTQEAFTLGQVSTVEFREAQLNLTRSEFRLVELLYQAKLSEVELYQLAGILVPNAN